MTLKIEDIECRLLDLNQRAEEIVHKAEGEARDLTPEEGVEVDRILNESNKLIGDRERLQELSEQSNRLSAAVGRKSEPDDVVTKADAGTPVAETAKRRPFATPRSDPKELSNYGWPSFGQFAKGVMLASRRSNAVIDPRLTGNAPTDYMREGVGEDGGFAVPPDYRSQIINRIMGEDSLLGRTDRQESSSNIWSQPVDNDAPWGTTGVRAYWTNEGAQKTQSTPNLQNVSLRLHKLAALIPVTDELREDAPAIDRYLMSRVPLAFDFEIGNAIINGSGVGQPLGIMNSGALVSVAKEGSQASATLMGRNIAKMWGRLYAGYRRNAVWLVNQDVEVELPKLAEVAYAADGSTAQGVAATYWAPGSIRNQNDFGLLYNRPVIVTEACPTLGVKGDIVLADLSQYLTVTKVGGLRSDISIHLWFDYDITAFRFVFRIAGAPWLQTPITRRNGTNTLSAFVTLDAR